MENIKEKIEEVLHNKVSAHQGMDGWKRAEKDLTDQIFALIQTEIEGCVPEGMPIINFTGEVGLDKDIARFAGYNNCRNQILTNLKQAGLIK